VAQLSASGSVEVQQDLLSISMSTTRDGTDAGVVQTQLKQALDTALAQAKQAAAPGQMDVRTGNFSLYPRYGKDGKINGWQGSTELVLEGKDFPRITGTAGKIQTLTMSNVSFALSREQRARVEGEAQAQAIERFKAKAGEVARNFGFSSYTLREVSINANDQGSPPRPAHAGDVGQSRNVRCFDSCGSRQKHGAGDRVGLGADEMMKRGAVKAAPLVQAAEAQAFCFWRRWRATTLARRWS
jgi:predicted secreted protein